MAQDVVISGESRATIRGPATILLLTVATLGLYGIYWWYETNRELRDLGRARGVSGLGDNPALSAVAFLVGACLVIPFVWTVVTTTRRIESAQELVQPSRRPKVAGVAALFIFSLAIGSAAYFVDGWSLVGVILVSLALEITAIAYMQAALNAIWLRFAGTPEPAEVRPAVAV